MGKEWVCSVLGINREWEKGSEMWRERGGRKMGLCDGYGGERRGGLGIGEEMG